MTWLQKICQAKPMALPFPRPDSGMSGIRRIDQLMTPEIAEKLQSLYPNISFYAAGGSGISADLGNGNYGKITEYVHEAECAHRLMIRPSKHAVKIYNVIDLGKVEVGTHVTIATKQLFLIEMEKVDPIHVPTLGNPFGPGEIGNEEWREIQNNLLKDGLPISDLGESNVGRNQAGDLVLLDLG